MTSSPFLLSALAAGMLTIAMTPACADDGYRLWLRYEPVAASLRQTYAGHATELVVSSQSATAQAAASELERGLSGLLGSPVPLRPQVDRQGAIVLERANSPELRSLHLQTSGLGPEGFLIRSAEVHGHHATVIAANRDIGLLYGVFALLRRMQAQELLDHLNVRSVPAYRLRVLNHWDNLDRTVERGYAGLSIWDWGTVPNIEQRYIDYARANASIGINGAVLNNVNADPKILTPEYLRKVAALAAAFRPYGIRVYLSVRFSSPIEVGGLKTADPLDPQVRAWWKEKADEVYGLIPNFGGFLVKANSEGQPGPRDYHRSQAEGANAIADALAPHGGTVFWRAFVYGGSKEDRAKQAFDEFKPLDGKFRNNVIVQVKNGAIDFQPREPFHPLFGQMPHTRLALEVQITREYLGQGTGVVYLGPMWIEALNADTCSPRCGTPVSATVEAMAGVSNIGNDRNWTGTNLDQANWYAFGRVAWNPSLSAQQIADEWTRLTWSNDARAVQPIRAMMLSSREAAVDYMTPLGLAHQFAGGHHYGPGPWECSAKEASWNPCYYNKADASGIGFNRTKTGSDAVDQYAPPVARRFADLKSTPDIYLLWFHHLPWTYPMRSGRSLWDELVTHYDNGVGAVALKGHAWSTLRPYVDEQRWAAVAANIRGEEAEAKWWRDASLAYFQSKSNLPLPRGHSPPVHPLSWYEAIHFEAVPGFNKPRIGPGTLCVPSGEGGAACVP